jgi:peptidoglycan/LPS O-acetylase OafA/YrhL
MSQNKCVEFRTRSGQFIERYVDTSLETLYSRLDSHREESYERAWARWERDMHKKPQLMPLTGIRFLLALWVVIFHQTSPDRWLGSWTPRLPGPLFSLVRTGYLAVDVFFVLSGFVLSYNYPLVKPWSRSQVMRFAVARFARIYPACCVGLLLVIPFVNYAAGRPVHRLLGALLNWTLLQSWIPRVAAIWNGPGWSLSDEAFFYFCFPIVGVMLWKFRRLRSLVAAGALLWCASLIAPLLAIIAPVCGFGDVPATSLHPYADPFWSNLLEFNPLLNLPAFCIGIVTGRIYDRLHGMNSPFVGRGYYFYVPGLLLDLLAIARANSVPYPLYHDALLTPVHALVILGLALGGGVLPQLLSLQPMVFLGNASYAIYILHRPIADWVNLLARKLFPAEPDGPGVTALYVAFVICLSAIVFKFVEEPANLILKNRLTSWFHASRWKAKHIASVVTG